MNSQTKQLNGDKNMKATKKLAMDIYEDYKAAKRCFNGGTRCENERMAPHCYKLLQEAAQRAEEAISNPSKRLKEDEWMWGTLNELTARAENFRVRYELTTGA